MSATGLEDLDDVRTQDPMRAFDVLWDFLVPAAEPRPNDLIFCFGSRDPAVPRRAAELHAQGTAAPIVVSGGVAHENGVTEAAGFACALTDLGVPADRIVTESASLHTGENVTLGLSAARDAGFTFSRVALVTWPVATRRSLATFRHLEPDLEAWSAPTTRRPDVRHRGSAKTARSCVEELEKIRHHAERGWIVPQTIPSAVDRAADVLRLHHDL
ncbi:MAG: YdcF family protein [Acidimicrobiia bacterium]